MCITVDHDTIKTQTVTVRCRDTMQQVCVCALVARHFRFRAETHVASDIRAVIITRLPFPHHGQQQGAHIPNPLPYVLLAPYLPRSAWVLTNW
jgi:hypothetical protein